MRESKFVSDRDRKRKAALSLPDLKRQSDSRATSEYEGMGGETGPALQGEVLAPPRNAALRMGSLEQAVGEGVVGAAGAIGNELANTFGIPGREEKEKARADTRAITDAAAASYHAGEGPRGQGGDQKVPAPSATAPMPKNGTGPGADAERPAAAAPNRAPGPTPTMVKLPDGRIVMGNNTEPYRQAGGSNISFQDAMAEQRLGAPQASRFMRDRSFRAPAPSQPYSEQVRALANSDVPDLSEEGGSGFGISPPASGGPSEGYRKLSGLEQALARRTWLEGRADTEQAAEAERAKLDREKRLAEMDPLEMARIQAQGRMGGDLAKVELDLKARQAAVQEHQRMSAQIEAAQAALEKASPEDAANLQKYIEYLVQTRREISNLLLGERLSDPRAIGDAFGAALAGFGLSGAAGVPPTGAR